MPSLSFVVDRMDDAALYTTLIRLVKALDPHDVLYDITKAHNQAVNALDIALELCQRGTQLSLLSSGLEESHHARDELLRRRNLREEAS